MTTLPLNANITAHHRFETGGTFADWTVSAGVSANVSVQYHPRAMRLTKDAAGVQQTATTALTLPSGKCWVEPWVWGDGTVRGKVSLLSGAGAEIVSLDIDGTGLTFDTNGATAQTKALTAANPARLTLLFDSGTVRCFYRTPGIYSSGGNYAPIGAALAYTGTIASVKVETLGTATGTFDVLGLFAAKAGTIAIGDSLTAGHAQDGAEWLWDNEYPYLLGYRNEPEAWVLNRGISSDRSADGAARLADDVLAHGPSEVVILYGPAAISRSESSATLITNVGAMVSACVSAGAHVTLCTSPFSSTWTGGQVAIGVAYNAWVQTQASDDVTLVQAADALVASPGIETGILASIYYDDIHPDETGMPVLASAIAQAMGKETIQAFTSTTADGYVENAASIAAGWAAAVGAAAGTAADYTATGSYLAGAWKHVPSGNYFVHRGFFPYTVALTDTPGYTREVLFTKVEWYQHVGPEDAGQVPTMGVFLGTTPTVPLAAADYDCFAAGEIAGRFTAIGGLGSWYRTYLRDSAIASVPESGTLRLVVREAHDIDSDDPTGAWTCYCAFADNTTAAYRPKVTVGYVLRAIPPVRAETDVSVLTAAGII